MKEADYDVFYQPRARAHKLLSRAVVERVRDHCDVELVSRTDRVEAQVRRAAVLQYWEEMP